MERVREQILENTDKQKPRRIERGFHFRSVAPVSEPIQPVVESFEIFLQDGFCVGGPFV